MKEKYILTALDSFVCLADKCSRDCCSRFAVSLDPDTHRKWQSLAATDANRAWLLAGVRQVTVGGKSELSIPTQENSADCYFLQPDRLCAIHGRLGHEFLSYTCRSYPRLKKTIGNREIMHATLSCPEIARLVLFDDSAPVFRHVPGKGGAAGQRGQSANEQVARFLDNLVVKLFATPTYPLNLRLTYLARVLAEIIALSERKQLSKQMLANFADKYHENLQGFAAAFLSGRFAAKPVNGLHMWDLLRAGAGRFNLFHDCGLSEHLPIMQLAKQAHTEQEAKPLFYQELMALRASARPQLQPYEKVFARYLQGRFMVQGFPMFLQQHPAASFLASVLPFAITQMLLWIKASASSPLTDQNIIDTVIRVEEVLFHSDELLKTLEKNQQLLNIGGYFDWFLEVC